MKSIGLPWAEDKAQEETTKGSPLEKSLVRIILIHIPHFYQQYELPVQFWMACFLVRRDYWKHAVLFQDHLHIGGG